MTLGDNKQWNNQALVVLRSLDTTREFAKFLMCSSLIYVSLHDNTKEVSKILVQSLEEKMIQKMLLTCRYQGGDQAI